MVVLSSSGSLYSSSVLIVEATEWLRSLDVGRDVVGRPSPKSNSGIRGRAESSDRFPPWMQKSSSSIDDIVVAAVTVDPDREENLALLSVVFVIVDCVYIDVRLVVDRER